jgi:hypothetical protein
MDPARTDEDSTPFRKLVVTALPCRRSGGHRQRDEDRVDAKGVRQST